MTRKEENAETIKTLTDILSNADISNFTSTDRIHLQLGIMNGYICDISRSLAILADDKEQDAEKTLNYYTTRCTSCGKVSPIGDYCIWCGEKGTCLEGDQE